MTEAFTYSMLCVGDAEFIRSAAIPLGSALEEGLGQEGRSADDWPAAPLLGCEPGPRADLASSAVLGVVLFLSSWAATKILDEVYAETLQPLVRRWLSQADKKVRKRKAEPTFAISLCYEDLGVAVVVLLKGDSYAALAAASELAVSAHRQALSSVLGWAEEGGVVLYVVEGESITARPEAFRSVADALRSADT
jgi:hypothetical protein